ncbi:MAG: UDP-N-acetylmuramoyl-L-alanine--D-glutamate ligase [Syntrophobacterales bacterium]|nr:UDP-N-acetylmuramoyl-L-alanine--D-glutamate ligase [Syntrophobacterales bacterium]
MEVTGARILVVGLARTGVALARFLAARGAQVTVTDAAPPEKLAEAREALSGLPVDLELGVPQPSGVWDYHLILLSPGVPPELPWLEAARRQGIPVWGELELARPFLTLPLIAISGTNGKTTTTTLTAELLRAGGLRPLVGGNIGIPLISLVEEQSGHDVVVLEVSSFQLDTAPGFHAHRAALLNISPDHLDRYPDFAAYVASKAGLFRHQGAADLRVLNHDDPAVRALAAGPARVLFFSAREPLPWGAWVEGELIRVRLPEGPEAAFPVQEIRLQGRHNLENIMAALLLALDAGVAPEACREVLARFAGLPHRLQYVATIDGVDYYDDSKGTNVGAVMRALEGFSRPVLLIAGGRDKDSDFSLLAPILKGRVRHLVLLGESKERLAQAWQGLAPIHLVADMAEAVRTCRRLARPGEVVLLSPACASFDMFRDYAHRGDTFQRLVREEAYGRKT